MSVDTARLAFVVAIGPLPGVAAPPTDSGIVPSGTLALRWLVAKWPDLTADQRQAAIGLLPELAAIGPVSEAGTHVLADLSKAQMEPAGVLSSQSARSDADYTKIAQGLADEIASRLQPNRALGIPIEAHRGPTNNYAETSVLNSSGGYQGAPGKCVIRVGPATDKLQSDDDVASVLGHEVWHCFEGAIKGLAWYWSMSSPWIDEGEAEWVGDSLRPTAPIDGLFWPAYLVDPSFPLFKRAYSAIGFYSQLASSGVDVWSKLVPILEAKDNVSAFDQAEANTDSFLDRWAAGYLRDASRGSLWDITGPGVTSDRVVPTNIHLGNGGSVGETASPYANDIAVFAETPDVLILAIAGHGRLSDGAGHDYVVGEGGAFCLLAKGCPCPQDAETGNPPPLPLDASSIALATTGGPNGSSETLDGLSLDDFCSRTISGTWTGTWQNDNGRASGGFTMVAQQNGKTFTGTIQVTGKTCVRNGTVQGNISGSTVTWGIASAERPVNFTGTQRGKSMSGTWSAIACGPPYGPANVTITVTGIWQATR